MTNLVEVYERKNFFKSVIHVQDVPKTLNAGQGISRAFPWNEEHPALISPEEASLFWLEFKMRHLDIKNYEHYDDHMRTTLTLDDDVADFLKEQSQLLNKPFKQVVNEVLRRGMTPGFKRSKPPKFLIVPNRSRLFPGVDPEKLNQFNDQLEAEDFAGEGST